MSEKGDTELAQALRLIVEWKPPQVESRGEMVPMGVAIGSKGERDYFRRIAQEAIAAHHTARAQQDELAKSRIGLYGGRRVALEDMANTPETQQKLRDLLDLMERMEAHDKSKSIPPGCEPDEPKAARAQPASVAGGWVMVPRKISEVQADILGIPVAWYERAVSIASGFGRTFAAPQPKAKENENGQ